MQNTDSSYIVGIFRHLATADQAMEALKQAGFREDQLKSTEHILRPAGEEQSPEITRFIVTIDAHGREQQAVGILFDSGANNSDLPPGMILQGTSIVSSEAETIDLIPTPAAATSFSKDSFFGEETMPGHPDEIITIDNPSAPHGL